MTMKKTDLWIAFVVPLLPFVLTAVLAYFCTRAFGQDFSPQRSLLKIELGKKLFHDTRISADNSTSCQTCHKHEKGWADGLQVAEGMARHIKGDLNTPTVLGASYQDLQFWDQRTDSLNQQASQPWINPKEMGNDSKQQVIDRLNSIPGYRKLFLEAWGELATVANASSSLEAFERTLNSWNAPIDKFLAGDANALTNSARRGYDIFVAASCIECHKPPFFRDGLAHNTGIAFKFQTGFRGRGKVESNSQKDGFVKTPTLREVGRTNPYTHAGVIQNLDGMVEHYNSGGFTVNGQRDSLIDRRVRPLGLTPQQKEDLVTFLFEAFLGSYPKIKAPELPQ